MPMDAYAPCPGGFDKKIKFCCADLTQELEKLSRMLDGDQRSAALEYIEKLEGKFSNRACLLSIKSAILASSEREEELAETVSRFLKNHPQNPIALAESALYTTQQRGIEQAVGQLQDGLERCGQTMPRQVYDAVGGMAVAALQAGRPISALAHLTLQVTFDHEDEAPRSLIGRILSAPSIPLLMKDERRISAAPPDAPWKNAFEDALREVMRGRWRRGAAWLLVLAAKHGNPPQLWETIASLRAWLADHAGACEALRRVAALDVPFEEAAEAEALAQLLDPVGKQRMIDIIAIDYPVVDIERLTELFDSSDQCSRTAIDRATQEDPNEPPPRAAFVLLDRPLPRTGAGITLAEIPKIVGSVYVYGKQTDREARLELVTSRSEEEESARNVVARIAGDSIGAAAEAKVIDQIHPLRHALAANWRLPDDTTPEQIRTLTAEFRTQNVLETWPTLPLPVLNEKSALEVKDDSKYRIKLAALVLLLEHSAQQEGTDLDFNLLRQKLNLPEAEAIDLSGRPLNDIPLARYPHLRVGQLADEHLIGVYQTAAAMGLRTLLRQVSEEILRRPTLESKVDLGDVYRTLSMTAGGRDEMLGYINAGRDWTVKKGGSSAAWDLEELSLRLSMMESEEASRLIQHLMREHANEPGVRETLAELLQAAGVIGPDGRPTGAMQPQPAGAVPTEAAEPGKIWTPEGEATSQGKSKLWVPGMD